MSRQHLQDQWLRDQQQAREQNIQLLVRSDVLPNLTKRTTTAVAAAATSRDFRAEEMADRRRRELEANLIHSTQTAPQRQRDLASQLREDHMTWHHHRISETKQRHEQQMENEQKLREQHRAMMNSN